MSNLSEEEIRQLELISQDIYPVKSYEFDKALRLADNTADFIEKAFGPDKKLSKDDFLKFQGTWDSLFEVRDSWNQIADEYKKLGLVGKITLFVKGVGSAKKLMDAFKKM